MGIRISSRVGRHTSVSMGLGTWLLGVFFVAAAIIGAITTAGHLYASVSWWRWVVNAGVWVGAAAGLWLLCRWLAQRPAKNQD